MIVNEAVSNCKILVSCHLQKYLSSQNLIFSEVIENKCNDLNKF